MVTWLLDFSGVQRKFFGDHLIDTLRETCDFCKVNVFFCKQVQEQQEHQQDQAR